MPIMPTQLLGLPDGTMTQGFATMYDLKLLARCDFDADGNMLDPKYDDEGNSQGHYSPLLVKGFIVD